MRLTLLPALAAALLSAASTVAPAAPDPDFSDAQLARWEARFRAADRDGNRGLDREEIDGQLPGELLARFDETDTDGDGLLQPEELLARQRELKAQREARRRRFNGRP